MTANSGPVPSAADLQGVVAKAYAAIAEPQSFVPLLNEMIAADEKLGGIGDVADMHFENAEAIFDKVYPLADADYSTMLTHLEQDLECDLALDQDFRVLTANLRIFEGNAGAISDGSGDGSGDYPGDDPGESAAIEREKYVPEWLFDPISKSEDQARLRQMIGQNAKGQSDAASKDDGVDGGVDEGGRMFLRLFTSPRDETGRWFSAQGVTVGDGHAIALQAVRLRWDERRADAFGQAFKLTDTELALTQHLVTGGTTREFAETRGRSVGTARNQLKALQRKLTINSKEQLLLLYAGFIHSLDQPEEDSTSIEYECANLFAEPGGGTIAWEEYGDPSGLPVLYIHALEGPLLTARVDAAARQAGLRIIGPWRPHHGDTTGGEPGPQSPPEFAARLSGLLDHLGIDRCTALGTQAGTPFLAAFAQAQPHRIHKAIAAGPFLPIVSGDDYRFLQTRQRIHFRIARIAPKFARVYLRAMLASMGTGEFHKFVDDYYDSCSRELQTVQRPEMVRNFRRAANYVLPRGRLGPRDTMLNWSEKWGDLLMGLGDRLTMLVGDQDSNTPPEFARLSADRFGLEQPQIIEDAGSFLIEDQPRAVFEIVRSTFD